MEYLLTQNLNIINLKATFKNLQKYLEIEFWLSTLSKHEALRYFLFWYVYKRRHQLVINIGTILINMVT